MMKNEGKELATSVTVSLPTRFQGVATIQALPLVSPLLPNVSMELAA